MRDLEDLTSTLHQLIGLQFDLELNPDEWAPELQPMVRAISALGATLQQKVVSSDHVGALFFASPVPLIQLSAARIITATNPAALQLFGPSAEGLPLFDMLAHLLPEPEDTVPTTEELLAGTRCELLGVGGQSVIYDLRLAPLHGRFGDLQGFVLSAHDVTSDVVARNRAEQQRADAEASQSARTRFLAMVSHELRTPLNGVIGMADFLDHEDPAVRTQATEVTRICSQQLAGLITEFLDFAGLSDGSSQPLSEPIDLIDLCRDCVRSTTAQLPPEVELRVDTDQIADPFVLGDPTRLRQVIDNLLQNAIRYTHTGWIALAIATEAQRDRVECEITVSDSGEGIATEDLDSIFEPYRRQSVRGNGVGLGLAIVRQAVQAMGGTIQVRSQPGKGSIFCLRLSLPRSSSPNTTGTQHYALSRTLRVLSVDDNEINREVLRAYLEAMGCEVEEAHDGLHCLERVYAHPSRYDVILMDCEMPRMDGPTACAELIRSGISVPVIAITAHALASQRALCIESGMVAFLTKPIQLEKLHETLQSIASPVEGTP